MKPLKANKLYGTRNYLFLGIALATLVAGYVFLGVKPKDGFLTMYAAPILLVVGYCVLIPIALFLKPEPSPVESQKQSPK